MTSMCCKLVHNNDDRRWVEVKVKMQESDEFKLIGLENIDDSTDINIKLLPESEYIIDEKILKISIEDGVYGVIGLLMPPNVHIGISSISGVFLYSIIDCDPAMIKIAIRFCIYRFFKKEYKIKNLGDWKIEYLGE